MRETGGMCEGETHTERAKHAVTPMFARVLAHFDDGSEPSWHRERL